MKEVRAARSSGSWWRWRRCLAIFGVLILGMVWALGSMVLTAIMLLEAGGSGAEVLSAVVVWISLLGTAFGVFAVGTRPGRRKDVLWRALAAAVGLWCVLLLVLVAVAGSPG